MEQTVKPYQLKALKSTDLFLILNLVKKVGLDKFTDIFSENIEKFKNVQSEEDYAKIGYAVVGVVQVILERLTMCEHEIYALLASGSNLTVEQIKELGMVDFIDMVTDFFKQKEFGELFTRAVSLLPMAK